MLTKVLRLEKLDGFRLRVRFNNGSEGVHDFAAMVSEPGPMLEPLRDRAYFARVFLEFGALSWPNGFDIAPEWLRREMEAAGERRSGVSAGPQACPGVFGGNNSSTVTPLNITTFWFRPFSSNRTRSHPGPRAPSSARSEENHRIRLREPV
jgi:hypothetical protein